MIWVLGEHVLVFQKLMFSYSGGGAISFIYKVCTHSFGILQQLKCRESLIINSRVHGQTILVFVSKLVADFMLLVPSFSDDACRNSLKH